MSELYLSDGDYQAYSEFRQNLRIITVRASFAKDAAEKLLTKGADRECIGLYGDATIALDATRKAVGA
ncbi:MAG TPA: hypothetical protein VNT79_09930 [Phycisphaerae bacterium]|nr:hypothetical protein [Phycisphaerae bacterium]